MFEHKNYCAARLMWFVSISIPHPNLVKTLEFLDGGGIVFTWRSTKFIVSGNLSVYEYDDGVSIGSDASILLREIIKRAAVEFEMKEAKND